METIVAVDPGWCSIMIDKIRRFDQKCIFEPFSTAGSEITDEPLPASPNNGVMDPKWVSEMIKKIRRFDHKCNFDPFFTSEDEITHEPLLAREKTAGLSKEKKERETAARAHVDESIKIKAPHHHQGSYASNKNFHNFKSTKEALAQILEALRDERSYMIGLYGKKGSGKTALVTAEIASSKNIFNKVVFVTVPGKTQVDMPKLRDRIASKLKLNFRTNASNIDRVIKINSTLKKKKKVLVIFDHVSAKFDPRDVGIPNPSEQCKLLWITRERKILTMIGCVPLIPLRPLSNDDAWLFFQQYSGIDDDHDLCTVAREVALRCKGLPRVIEDVVSSLENKNAADDTKLKEYWTETLDCLKHESASYQIFISFRGTDTRDSFTEFLYDALDKAGFKVFIDTKAMRRGDKVSETLFKVIEQSRCSIVVLSENYAQSSWCLNELLKIMECSEQINQLVYPIFYKVDPSDVRHVKGTYKEAMTKNEERFGKDKVQEWTSALYKIASLSGNHHPSGSHKTFIKEVVKYVKDNKHRLHIV